MDDDVGDHDRRRDELTTALTDLRSRIALACERAHRDPSEITLIAVTKTFPASDVQLLADIGLRDLGENKDQEARAKAAQLSEEVSSQLRWHFLGQLQRNKCRSIASYAHAVHSVDRLELVKVLATAAHRRDTPLEVFVQANLDSVNVADRLGEGHETDVDPTRRRGGTPPQHAVGLATEILRYPQLILRGVMGIAPAAGDAFAAFAQLKRVSDELRQLSATANAISAGMSGDLEAAIAAGATHVRVGSALLGIR